MIMSNYKNDIPKHLAIIMDGNGRWAERKGKNRIHGHSHGVRAVQEVVEEAVQLKVEYLTLYAFSTENWSRPKSEIKYLFSLLETFLVKQTNELHKKNIKIKVIGNKNFSVKLNTLLTKVEKKTLNNDSIQLNLALNYGSKIELIYAFKKLIKKKIL